MHVGVGLLHLVEQHHAVRAPPHRLGQHAALAVADVARRRALQRETVCSSWNSDMLMVIMFRSPP